MESIDRLAQATKKIGAVLALSFFVIFAGTLHAHKGESHNEKNIAESPSSANEGAVLKGINEEYMRTIKPIFQRSCMNCHGSNTEYPWYYSLPGAKQLIDFDTRESKIHLDMSNNFPFGGHGSPQEDLAAIQDSIEKGTMPPFRYKLLNWSSKLKSEEIQIIQNWTKSSIEKIKNVEKKGK